VRLRGTCWLRHLGGCGGGYEWHHHIRQQTLNRVYGPAKYPTFAAIDVGPDGFDAIVTVPIDVVLGDGRNVDDTCTRHHEMITCKSLVIVRADLPYKVEDFAHEYRLEAALDAEYGPWDDLAAAIAKRTGYVRKVVEAWLGQQRVRIGGVIAPYGSTVPPGGLRDVTIDGRAIL
jgi:hypothetical protein